MTLLALSITFSATTSWMRWPTRLAHQLRLLLLTYCALGAILAQAQESPGLRATVYATSALELFWNRPAFGRF